MVGRRAHAQAPQSQKVLSASKPPVQAQAQAKAQLPAAAVANSLLCFLLGICHPLRLALLSRPDAPARQHAGDLLLQGRAGKEGRQMRGQEGLAASQRSLHRRNPGRSPAPAWAADRSDAGKGSGSSSRRTQLPHLWKLPLHLLCLAGSKLCRHVIARKGPPDELSLA